MLRELPDELREPLEELRELLREAPLLRELLDELRELLERRRLEELDPPLRRSAAGISSRATVFASTMGSCSTTRHTPVPSLMVVVTAAAAMSDTKGSAMW